MGKTASIAEDDPFRRANAMIERRLAEGRGQTRGPDYIPWLKVGDVSSEGWSTRIKGWRSQRVHHFLSRIELNCFYCLEYFDEVVEVREQYPLLPLEETLAIADQAGIKHPFDRRKKVPVVMTTDFCITVGTGITTTEYARTVKPAAKLADRRVLEKFEIERRYWARRNTNWGIVTEREIPVTLAQNMSWLHTAYDLADCGLTLDQLRRIEAALRTKLLSEVTEDRHVSLSEMCAACDDRSGHKMGDAMTAVRHLLARKVWRADMLQQIQVGKPLRLEAAYPEMLSGD